MHKGFIKLHRKLTEWEWYDDPNTFRLFIHLLLKANYKDKKWHGITVKRGSFITGYDKLTSELNLSKQQIRTSITKLKSTGEITYQSTHQYSVATIVNYDVHQDREKVATHQVTPKATPYQHTSNTRATPTKNVKKDKNVKNKDTLVTKPNGLMTKSIDVLNLWNEFAQANNLPQKRAPTDGLKQSINNITKKQKWKINDWDTFLNLLSDSDFLMGKTSNWKMNMDWLAKPTNFSKAISGNYHE